MALAWALIAAGGGPARAAEAASVTVFAAASLTPALEAVGQLWQQREGGTMRFSFAASSTLARQIAQGAAADIFASADKEWMDYLAGRGLIEAASRRNVLGNRLVLIVPAANPRAVAIGPGLDLAALLGDGRLATGDPAHVPVGRYAQQALTALGLWEIAAPRLARADNVRAALLLVERGEAPVGIVYATDAAENPRIAVAGVFPADSHAPIRYPFAIVAGRDTPTTRAAFAFLGGAEAGAVYRRFGFAVE